MTKPHGLGKPNYFTYLRIAPDKCLPGYILVEELGETIGGQVISALAANRSETDSLDDICGLYAARTTVNARKAGKAAIERFGLEQGLNITALYHLYELMGVILHLVVRRAGCGALSAHHALVYINAARHGDLLGEIFLIGHHSASPSLMPERFCKQLGEIDNGETRCRVLSEVVHAQRACGNDRIRTVLLKARHDLAASSLPERDPRALHIRRSTRCAVR